MNAKEFIAVFPRQLRFWALHCSLNALPSFLIALFFLQLLKKPFGIAAMLTGIVSFIFIYATVTSLLKPLADEQNLLHRAMKLGTKIRVWISAISVCLIPLGGFTLLPDFWCGWLSIAIIEKSTKILNSNPSPGLFDLEGTQDLPTFISIYTTTMLEGFLLSAFLMIICYFALNIIQFRDRKKLEASFVSSEN